MAPWLRGTRRHTLETVVTNGLTGAVGLATGALGARLLGPVGKGELAVLQVVGTIVATTGALGLADAVTYYGARDRQGGPQDAVAASTFLLAFGVVVLPIAMWLVPYVLPTSRPGVVHGAQIYVLVFPSLAILGSLQSLLRAAMRLRRWNMIRLGIQSIWLGVLIFASIVGLRVPEHLATIYVGALFAFAVMIVIGHWKLWSRGWPPRWLRLPRLLRYGLPLAGRTAPRMLNLRLDVMLIAIFLPAGSVGLYSAAVAWSMILMPLPRAVASVLLPRLSGERDVRTRRRIERTVLVRGAMLLFAFAVLLGLAAPLLFPMLFGAAFQPAVRYAIGLVGAGWFLGVGRLLAAIMESRGSTLPVLHSEVVALGVTVLALLSLLRPLGVWGAVIASCAAYACSDIILIVALRRSKVPSATLQGQP